MKIHVLINCYWGNGMSGGDRRSIEMLRRWHDTNEYQFIVYTTHRFYKLMQIEHVDNYRVCYTDVDGADEKHLVYSYIKRTNKCFLLLKKNYMRGDIFYSTTDILPDVVPAAFVKRRNGSDCKWVITTYHIFEAFYKRPGNIITNFLSCYQQKYAIYLGRKYADLYLTTSPIVIDHFRKSKFSMSKVRLSACAVDIDKIDKANEETDHFDACFLARLNYSKGVFELPEIWKEVTFRYPKAKLAIMGKGSAEFEQELRKHILNLKMENNISLLGYVSSEKGWSIIKQAGCFLFTSHEEGWGMAVAESLAAGTPVVAYRLPIFEILFPEGTLYSDFKDTKMMAEKVCELLGDKKYRNRLGDKGSKYVREHYTLDNMAAEELKYLLYEDNHD